MDSIRVSKVEKVLCGRSGSALSGSLHLTAHHLIFRYDDVAEEEMWMPYSLLSLVLHLPQTLHGQSPITFHTRTFETFSLMFVSDRHALDVFDSIKELTVCTSVNQLYAFFYTPDPPLDTGGWSIYSPRKEFGRMGIGTRTKAWRLTDINKDYQFSPTYPSLLAVPTRIGDSTLQYAAKYRSKSRVPALTYMHWANYATITRSSQPMVGFKQNRSVQDEKLVEAIFQSHHFPDSRSSSAVIYGATPTNLIVDARPTANAMANTAKGAGTENMEHYRDAKKIYSGIDHIHAMRESLAKVVDALREADSIAASVSGSLPGEARQLGILDRQALRRSGWLRHMSNILEAVVLIVRNVHISSSHVLIHCSDGWDRTSQLAALAQLCLDPFYRTIRGFQVLVEKDWISFGHRFLDRCGHLSSEKFFTSLADSGNMGSSADAAQAFLTSVQNRFASQHHIKETSPSFHQFLECVRQIQRQYPERFEFNERFLRTLHYHLYSCQFGTFLYNSERERRRGEDGFTPSERTTSIWDFFNSHSQMEVHKNQQYDPTLDDPSSRAPQTDMGVLLPNAKDVRFWHELYARSDEEMNGKIITSQVKGGPDFDTSIKGLDDGLLNSGAEAIPSVFPSAISPLTGSPSASPAKSSGSSIAPEGLSSSFQGLWTSLPELGQKIGGGFLASPPLFSDSSTPPRPLSQNRMRSANASDPPAGSRVKQMWGKFSSNATAAFSAVQEVYDGVTRDFTIQPRPFGDNEEIPDRGSELQLQHGSSWDGELSSPHGNERSSALRSADTLWDSAKSQRSLPVLPVDNPWANVRSSSPQPLVSQHDVIDSSPLPKDPTVAHPPQRQGVEFTIKDQFVSTVSHTPPNDDGRNVPEGETDSLAHSAATDPLGVGLL